MKVVGYAFGVLVNGLAGAHACPGLLRLAIYRLAGMRVSLGAQVSAGVIFRVPSVVIGGGTTINYRCVFDNRSGVTIGRRCGIGIEVQFITSDHDYSDPSCRAGRGTQRPILVGDGVWIGSRVTVLNGVTVGAGAVIAAGSVVRDDVPPHVIVAGVPARIIRQLAQ